MKQSESVSIPSIFGLMEQLRSSRLLIFYKYNEKVDMMVTQEMDKSIKLFRSFFLTLMCINMKFQTLS